jgi:hypothetical protein
MKGGFPPAPEPIHGFPTLTSLIDLLFHLCRCMQTHRSPASAKMNLLFCAAPRDVYEFLTTEAYPDAFAPFPPVVSNVPDFSPCTDKNERAAVRATHARDKKTRADIVTMNAALCDVFLENMSTSVRASVLQRRLSEPNIVFIDLFLWFVKNYGKTTAEDREGNRRRMAADWHPADGFDSLIHRLFTVPATPAALATRCTMPTSSTSASASLNDAGCTPKSTSNGSRVRPSPPRSSRPSCRSRRSGQTKSPL